jgi:hypothetical protein
MTFIIGQTSTERLRLSGWEIPHLTSRGARPEEFVVARPRREPPRRGRRGRGVRHPAGFCSCGALGAKFRMKALCPSRETSPVQSGSHRLSSGCPCTGWCSTSLGSKSRTAPHTHQDGLWEADCLSAVLSGNGSIRIRISGRGSWTLPKSSRPGVSRSPAHQRLYSLRGGPTDRGWAADTPGHDG